MASARISSALLAAALALAHPAAAAPAPAAGAERPADFAPRRVAADLARAVEQMFLYPDVGRRYAAAIRSNAAAGAYDGITDRAAFAARLTADLQLVSAEGHLRVLAGHSRSAVAPRPALEDAGWVAPGVAYVRLNNMLGAPDTLARLDNFLQSHDDARTLLIDLRGNAGGGLAEMDLILPWLYRAPALLMRMDSRAGVGRNPMAGIPSMRRQPAPPGILRFDHWVVPRLPATPLADARVCVLTSASTISAAEHLALALQHSGRARIVGERTSGAGHYGPIVRLADGFAAFIPVGRSYEADSGVGWEGTGVAPDIAVPQQQALATALSVCAGPESATRQPADTDKPLQSGESR